MTAYRVLGAINSFWINPYLNPTPIVSGLGFRASVICSCKYSSSHRS